MRIVCIIHNPSDLTTFYNALGEKKTILLVHKSNWEIGSSSEEIVIWQNIALFFSLLYSKLSTTPPFFMVLETGCFITEVHL